ncbi:DinB family protein [Flavobacterium silvaticum]|uniref:DinB family protein n=1 Tax=Flavobacterium silvaticum TaxID=1852020 RepID=A0A972FMQ8_9FLAO|nr:DUF1572 domain-containing protein [Flavobacterium silvaticum]NMH28899.1 DinB family protein [Flavobacterium silvaticum]
MERNIFISNRIREVLLDGTWIANTNFKDQITHVTWKEAIQKVGNLNTIAALTFHINYYLDGLIRAFDTGKLDISDPFSFDVPEIGSDAEWKNLTDSFLTNATEFAIRVEQMPDEKFDEPFIDPKYGNYLRNIEGIIEHSYYHLGQVVLIRKMIVEKRF